LPSESIFGCQINYSNLISGTLIGKVSFALKYWFSNGDWGGPIKVTFQLKKFPSLREIK